MPDGHPIIILQFINDIFKCPLPPSPFTFFLGFLNITATFLGKTNTFSFFNFYTFINVLYRRKTFKVAVSKKFRKPCFSIVRWKIRCVSTTSKAPADPVWFAIFSLLFWMSLHFHINTCHGKEQPLPVDLVVKDSNLKN